MKFISQHDQMDCGPACLSMIINYYGKNYPLKYLRKNSFITREGVSLLGIDEVAQKVGLNSFSTNLPLSKLIEKKNIFPCILHWNQNHFVVLYGIKKNFFSQKTIYKIADPGYGLIKLNENQFKKRSEERRVGKECKSRKPQ